MCGLVLGCGIIAKVCLLTMTSSLRSGLFYTPCAQNGKTSLSKESIHSNHILSGPLLSYISEPDEKVPENAATWFYWYIWLALVIPEVLTFCRCIRLALFKYVPKPTIYLFMVVSSSIV